MTLQVKKHLELQFSVINVYFCRVRIKDSLSPMILTVFFLFS